MTDSMQLLTVFNVFFYMGIGAIIGFFAGVFIVSGYCIGHPVVLAWWERRRMVAELRKCGRILADTLAEKMSELDLQMTREILKEQMRDAHDEVDAQQSKRVNR